MKIFVSYTSSDRDWAHWIGWQLLNAKHEPFVHEWEVGGGESIPRWMEQRLQEAERLLGVFSDDYCRALYSNSERWVAHWNDPDGRNGFLLPVEVKAVTEWPMFVKPLRRLSLVDLEEDEARQRLIAFLETPQRPTRRPTFPGGFGSQSSGPSAPTPKLGGRESHLASSNDSAFMRDGESLQSSPPRFPLGRPDRRAAVERRLRAMEERAPRVAVVIAARAALRVAPALAVMPRRRAGGFVEADYGIILSSFRAMAAAWAIGRYPAQAAELSAAASAARTAASEVAEAPAVEAAKYVVRSSADAASIAAIVAASAGADAIDFVAETAASAAASAGSAAIAAATDADSTTSGAAWDAALADVSAVEDGLTPVGLAGRKLWLNERPDWATSSWKRLSEALIENNEDWEVWTTWYQQRLDGDKDWRPIEAIEVDRVLISDETWQRGPLAANAEIRRLIDERRPEAKWGDSNWGEASWGGGDAVRLQPPFTPLPEPSPATRFVVIDGKLDVVPPTAWQDRLAQAAGYHARAVVLTTALAGRLGQTDAVPDVAGSVASLLDVLGEDIAQVQPDQLRLASRSIAAKARAFGHPAAQWEISAESVSALFELADVLVDLQAFVTSDLQAHENAIRQLGLTPATAAEAKAALDLITDGILAAADATSEQVTIAFEAAANVSDTAVDPNVRLAIEGDRILLAENAALAIARELGRSDAAVGIVGAGGEPPSDTPPPSDLGPKKPEKPKKPKKVRRPHHARGIAGDRSWNDFADRVLARIHNNGPDAVADAAIQAAVWVIKHFPKTILAIAAAIAIAVTSSPFLLGGTITTTVAWIIYELRRRKGPPAH